MVLSLENLLFFRIGPDIGGISRIISDTKYALYFFQ